ncbi:hypothetical protein P170DRAFT_405285 [Aspergillus steynii IBT 23096]|uniref:C2H2-type domain-containing protein n=1 Tax=Aspergillus steynii IBT 23096 TaxID=1392250 RepID=A0A2I2GBR3_9EURO|nr:uncharacterized protein P170DRAFT_405285 [Aspergillus steynii IBT 23096]PLB50321.1 hypothetical protein P170DRAFT_405285 [Aspergillus steynii IBT 23096]
MDWTRTVFRLRALPDTVETQESAAHLLSERLNDVSVHHIWIHSLATTLKYWEDPPTKVATVMFSVPPSLVQREPNKQEWQIPAKGHDRNSRDFILDTHFIGLTPLNDTSHLQNSYNCIAISGLASHPFGSWQPKGGDKRFMWIRDDLAKHARGGAAILYGYDSKLNGSSSFQNINDLAKELIDQLFSHRAPGSVTPLIFLAHSLGGLVVKQALRDLAENHPDDEYKNLLSAVRGAIFFGVPNRGMEHGEFEAVVQNNPNGVLIQDLSLRSNFIRQLTRAFDTLPFVKRCKFFWAYETKESPTVLRRTDGQLTRDGPSAILVSPESATCGFINANRAVTFPIHASHSDMVKFSQDSHYYSSVRAKLLQILQPPTSQTQDDNGSDAQSENIPETIPTEVDQSSHQMDLSGATRSTAESHVHPQARSIAAELEKFKRLAKITESEEEMFINTTSSEVEDTVRKIQMEQELSRNMKYMARLEPFLASMKQFGELAREIKLFTSGSNSMAYTWGPLRYILDTTCGYPQEFDSILNSYQAIGDQIPKLSGHGAVFVDLPYLMDVLVMIYSDVLSFQAEILGHLKPWQWDQLFQAWLRDFTTRIDEIAERTGRNKRLIENKVSFMEFETIRKDDLIYARALKREKEATTKVHKDTVENWLSAFDSKAEHHLHQEKRRVCKDPGRWLLGNREFNRWASPDDSLNPLLWLSGIPGAGKTILASVVIDELSSIQGATVAYFYCKHGDEKRNSDESVTRSILAQVLDQNPDLLSYFYEKAHMNASLVSPSVSEQMLRTSMGSCRRVYVVLDGLDECGRAARKHIASRFRQLVDEAMEVGSIRCLFVSQEDGAAAEDFRYIQSIKIGKQNSDDISSFAGVWQGKIIDKFGTNNHTLNIQDIVFKRAKGMFIFAELFANYLWGRLSIEDLQEQLFPENLPVDLDNLYERILYRVREVRDVDTMRRIEEILGWIVCARRPLRWEEIQGAVCTNPECQSFDALRRLADSPREIFASLVECYPDGTVDLVHGTARQYLTKRVSEKGPRKEPVVKLHEAHFSLAMRCLTYLAFPQLRLDRRKDDIKSDLLDGFHQLYDYASACWAMHLEGGISDLGKHDLTRLRDALKRLVKLHWSKLHKPLQHVERVRTLLSPLEKLEEKGSNQHEKIIQAVAWAKKQSGLSGIGPSDEEALTLWKMTAKIRSISEKIDTNGDEFKTIKSLYGAKRFKCPRVNCYSYHHGFQSLKHRDRHTNKHTRPYLCIVASCPMGVFGYELEKKLKKHLFDVHHIDEASDRDEPDYPDPPKEKTSKSGQGEANFKCPDCNTPFKQKKSLNRHIKSHTSGKPFSCDKCDKRFSRREDCERHQDTHSDEKKKYICAGVLKDGTKWGCNASFSRGEKLRDHFRPEKRRKCILPLLLEKQKAGDGDGRYLDENVFADQTKVLLDAGKKLPSFRVFLEQCGLDVPGGGNGDIRSGERNKQGHK